MIERHYGFGQILKLCKYYLQTKLICSSARLIRTPIDIRGKKYINWGQRLTTGIGCRIEALKVQDEQNPEIIFGNNVQINDYVHICALSKVIIGNDVLIASHVYISDNSHGYYKGSSWDSSPLIPPIQREYFREAVHIGDRVWIGEGVMILPGVSIGSGSVVGAHSIVKDSIPDNCIAVGAPAKVIKHFNFETHRWERI